MSEKIKFYGIADITKKQYIYAQSATFVALALFWVWALFGNFNELVFGFGTILLAIATVGELVETYMTFRKFKN